MGSKEGKNALKKLIPYLKIENLPLRNQRHKGQLDRHSTLIDLQ